MLHGKNPPHGRKNRRNVGNPHLADGGQFGKQHLEDWRRQRLLEYLKELLRLATYCNGIGQVVHTFLEFTYGLGLEKGV